VLVLNDFCQELRWKCCRCWCFLRSLLKR